MSIGLIIPKDGDWLWQVDGGHPLGCCHQPAGGVVRANVFCTEQPPAAVDVALAGRGEECFLFIGASFLWRVLLRGHAARVTAGGCDGGCAVDARDLRTKLLPNVTRA